MDAAMFHPHGWCFQWEPPLIGLHVGSDAVTALAYFSLPLGLGHLMLRRRDLPFKLLFALCGAFIVLCGLTHVASILVIWQPLYWMDAVSDAQVRLGASIGVAGLGLDVETSLRAADRAMYAAKSTQRTGVG